jgi:hypothetical protein
MQSIRVALVVSIVFLASCAIPVSANVIPGMDLSASPAAVIPGGILTYTITASNSGTTASSPTILFGYDPYLDYQSATPVSTQEILGQPVTSPAFWVSTDDPERIIRISPGGSYTITVVTQVKADVPCGTTITSTATMNDAGNGGGPTSATESVTTPVTCGIPAPEFPSPVLPVALLGLLTLGIVIIRTSLA